MCVCVLVYVFVLKSCCLLKQKFALYKHTPHRDDHKVLQDWVPLWAAANATRRSLDPPTSIDYRELAYYDDNGNARSDLQNGRKYVTFIRSTNELGQQTMINSDGFVVQVEPPRPGYVADGLNSEFDMNYQESTSEYSASWTDCRICLEQNLTCRSCFGDVSLRKGQVVQWYAVALGTNTLFPKSRSNVVPYVSIGLNTTWTFVLPQPLKAGTKYFITVRAYSSPDVFSEVSSNGELRAQM